jgi:hypothetical protein
MSRKGKILFQEVIRYMYSGITFDIKVVTYSQTKKTGGEIREYKGARLAIESVMAKERSAAAAKVEGLFEIPTGNTKHPRHNVNRTLNLLLVSGEIRKIRRVLIIEFNNQEVII